MKKLLFLLFLLPAVCFSQTEIPQEEILQGAAIENDPRRDE